MDPRERLSSDCLDGALTPTQHADSLENDDNTAVLLWTPGAFPNYGNASQQWDGNIIQASGQSRTPGIEWIGGAQTPVGLRPTQTPNQGYEEDFNDQPGSLAVTSKSWATNNAQASAEARGPSTFPSSRLGPDEPLPVKEGGFVMQHDTSHYIPIHVDGKTVMVRKKDHWVNVSNILKIKFNWRSQYAPILKDLKTRHRFEIIKHSAPGVAYGTYFPPEVGLELCKTYRLQTLETLLIEALQNYESASEEPSLEDGPSTPFTAAGPTRQPDSSHPAYSGAGPTILETYPEASDHSPYTQGGISQVPDNCENSSWTFTNPSFTYWP
jgi:hypothetical protein